MGRRSAAKKVSEAIGMTYPFGSRLVRDTRCCRGRRAINAQGILRCGRTITFCGRDRVLCMAIYHVSCVRTEFLLTRQHLFRATVRSTRKFIITCRGRNFVASAACGGGRDKLREPSPPRRIPHPIGIF